MGSLLDVASRLLGREEVLQVIGTGEIIDQYRDDAT